ncbi:MAG: glycosyltransferase [Halobacteriota archaeon]
MRIAFILGKFPKISETFILNQITGLIDLGHEVEIFAFENPEEEVVHPDVERYQLMRRVHYFSKPKSESKRIFKVMKLIISNFHRKPAVIIRSLKLWHGKRYLFYWLYPFLYRDFDIIHCHFGPNAKFGAYLKQIGVPGKLIAAFHGYDMSKLVLDKGKDVYVDLFSKGDLFMPISDYWKNRLMEMGCDKDKIIVHHMGINPRRFEFLERKPNDGPVKILMVGRLTEKKGHQYAIKAIAKVLRFSKNIQYLIAGDGPLKDSLESLTTSLGVEDYVKFLGRVNDSELLKLYREAHIFLLPSVTSRDGDKEGIPVVLMESMATGLPVVSTKHSGIPELVSDGESGFLVPEKDIDSLAEKIEYLIKNPELWPEMGREGRKIVEEYYDIDKLNRRLVDIYKSLSGYINSF